MGKPNRQEKHRKESSQDSAEGRLEPDLFVAATPIGNLGDVTGRLRQELGVGRTLLCEDTRRTSDLCRALGVATLPRMERCDAHSRKTLIQGWVKRAQAGEKFMLVTDAGTPSISDPGAAVVAAFAAEGLSVEALPGPSAVATALSLSGFESTAYTFWGFFGRSAADQSDALQRAEAVVQQGVRVHVWFESPERIAKTLATCAEEGNAPGIQVAAFRELTKRFETAYRGTLPEVARQVAASEERGEARGEWVVVLYWPSLEAKPPGGEKVDWESALRIALRAGAPTSAAAREVAAAFGVSRSEVYERATQMKKI